MERELIHPLLFTQNSEGAGDDEEEEADLTAVAVLVARSGVVVAATNGSRWRFFFFFVYAWLPLSVSVSPFFIASSFLLLFMLVVELLSTVAQNGSCGSDNEGRR